MMDKWEMLKSQLTAEQKALQEKYCHPGSSGKNYTRAIYECGRIDLILDKMKEIEEMESGKEYLAKCDECGELSKHGYLSDGHFYCEECVEAVEGKDGETKYYLVGHEGDDTLRVDLDMTEQTVGGKIHRLEVMASQMKRSNLNPMGEKRLRTIELAIATLRGVLHE